MTGENAPATPALRETALALYEAPFRFKHGFIYDANDQMVADQGGNVDEEVKTHIIARIRGWGRISSLPNAEALQDEVGKIVAEALTKYWQSQSTGELS